MGNPTKSGRPRDRPPVAEWYRPATLDMLRSRDFIALFRHLQKIGYSQARLGTFTDQSQPEISAIIRGRRVIAYDVMKRAADGLGIPLCLVGMASCGTCGHRDRPIWADASVT